MLNGAEPPSASFVVEGAPYLIPLAGLIDKTAELARLDRELAKLDQNIGRLQGQLSNERFVANAPAELVANTRAQLQSDENQRQTLSQQRAQIAQL